MIKIVNYNIDHLFDLHIDFDKYPMCKNNIVVLHNICSNSITAKTFIDDTGKAFAVIAVLLYHTGVAGIFIIPSIDAHGCLKKAFISSVFSLRDELENIVRENKLRRIETLCIDDEKHNRWMQYLGFSVDGTKQAYGVNGEDFIMWSRLWV